MRLVRFECDAQRLAGAEQLRLADHVVERSGSQAFGERRAGRGSAVRPTLAPGARRLGRCRSGKEVVACAHRAVKVERVENINEAASISSGE